MSSDHLNDLGQPVGVALPEWRPRPRPPRTPMVGRWCCLTPLDAGAHAEDLYRALTAHKDSRSWTYLPYGPFAEFEAFRSWLMTECVGEDPLFHAIVDTATGAAAGLASYLRITPQVGAIEVGHIHYSPSLQRTAAATEAMYLMMARAFDELGYRRYEWKCDALNQASRQAALRLGFSFEGIFRQATVYKNRNRDTAWYSVIDKEWPKLRTAYQAWLSPDNFDAQSVQRRRLSELTAACQQG